MLILTTVNDNLQVVLSGAVTTRQLNCLSSWRDITTTTFTPGRTPVNTNNTTDVNIVTAPAASTQRVVDFLSIYNADTVTQTITVKLDVSGTEYVLWKGNVASGNTLMYVDGNGFSVADANQSVADHNHTSATDGGVLTDDAHDGYSEYDGISVPSAPATNKLRIFARKTCGRMLPKWIGPSGLDTFVQPAFFGNNIVMWSPTTVTAGLWYGTVGAGLGTYSTALPTTTNLYTAMKRARYTNIITTANQDIGQRSSELMYFRGSVAGQGGFFFFARFGFDVWTAGGRLFMGLAVSTTPTTANPSALVNCLGFGIDAGDTAITFMHNDATGSAVKDPIAGQPSLANNQGYDAYIWCKPNDTAVYYRLDDINTQTTIIDTSTSSELPVNTTMMALHAKISNAAVTPATSVQLGLNRIYCETDY